MYDDNSTYAGLLAEQEDPGSIPALSKMFFSPWVYSDRGKIHNQTISNYSVSAHSDRNIRNNLSSCSTSTTLMSATSISTVRDKKTRWAETEASLPQSFEDSRDKKTNKKDKKHSGLIEAPVSN